ncbi:NUDIX domain-containing protein [Patescibacteria group bacterium]
MDSESKIILIKDNKVLLNHRDDKEGIANPGMWSLIGGMVEVNESPVETIIREVKEEINLDIENPVLLPDVVHAEHGSKHRIHIFKANTDKEIDELALGEGQELRYFSYEEALNLKITNVFRKLILDTLTMLNS